MQPLPREGRGEGQARGLFKDDEALGLVPKLPGQGAVGRRANECVRCELCTWGLCLYHVGGLMVMKYKQLTRVITSTIIGKLLPSCSLMNICSHATSGTRHVMAGVRRRKGPYTTYTALRRLLNLGPSCLMRSTSPDTVGTLTLPTLGGKASVVALSVNTLTSAAFCRRIGGATERGNAHMCPMSKTAKKFSILEATFLVKGTSTHFFGRGNPGTLGNATMCSRALRARRHVIFSKGTARTVNVFPAGIGMTITTSLTSINPRGVRMSVRSAPKFMKSARGIRVGGSRMRTMMRICDTASSVTK